MAGWWLFVVMVFFGCCFVLFWWLWVGFDWGAVANIGGLGGSNCGCECGFGCCYVGFCIWVCFELFSGLWIMLWLYGSCGSGCWLVAAGCGGNCWLVIVT